MSTSPLVCVGVVSDTSCRFSLSDEFLKLLPFLKLLAPLSSKPLQSLATLALVLSLVPKCTTLMAVDTLAGFGLRSSALSDGFEAAAFTLEAALAPVAEFLTPAIPWPVAHEVTAVLLFA